MRWFFVILFVVIINLVLPYSQNGVASEFMVYNVHRGISLGSDEVPEKDYFINMGARNGLSKGSRLLVFRRVSTYDSLNEQLYKEITFPIAYVRVIHVEPGSAVARLEKFISSSETPAISPLAIMVGDRIQFQE